MPAAHQHTCQEEHRQTLTTSCSTKVCTTFTITKNIDMRMLQDILVEPMRSKELWIATNDLQFVL